VASIHKDPRGKSPFWYCAFIGGDGRRKLRSTKETDRTAARKICYKWAEAAEKARRHELTAAQSRKVLSELTLLSSGEQMEFHSVEGWLTDWLASKAGSTAKATLTKYRQVLGSFLDHLAERATSPLASVSPADIATFRDALRSEGRKPETANLAKNVLNGPFEAARRQGVISFNPVGAVDNLRIRPPDASGGREAFSHEEVSRLVAQATGAWRGAILLAATSGLRLSDIASLQWGSVDMVAGMLRVATGKTGAVVVLPIHPDFAQWLASRQRGIERAKVFPELAEDHVDGARGLSNQFTLIVKKAGILRRVTPGAGKGRTTTSKTFHSLRHAFISQLANNDVAPDIRQRLVGHADSKVHAGYSHHELATLRSAIEKLPSLKAP
jgi:integrase